MITFKLLIEVSYLNHHSKNLNYLKLLHLDQDRYNVKILLSIRLKNFDSKKHMKKLLDIKHYFVKLNFRHAKLCLLLTY